MPRKSQLEQMIDATDREIADAEKKHADHMAVLRHSRARLVSQHETALAKRQSKVAPDPTLDEPCDARR